MGRGWGSVIGLIDDGYAGWPHEVRATGASFSYSKISCRTLRGLSHEPETAIRSLFASRSTSPPNSNPAHHISAPLSAPSPSPSWTPCSPLSHHFASGKTHLLPSYPFTPSLHCSNPSSFLYSAKLYSCQCQGVRPAFSTLILVIPTSPVNLSGSPSATFRRAVRWAPASRSTSSSPFASHSGSTSTRNFVADVFHGFPVLVVNPI